MYTPEIKERALRMMQEAFRVSFLSNKKIVRHLVVGENNNGIICLPV
jgi:hypothetical protein